MSVRDYQTGQMQRLKYFAAMYRCYQAMPQNEKDAFHAWERDIDRYENGTSAASHAWPGWEKYIGPMPTFPEREVRVKSRIPYRLRMRVFERDGFKCLHCGAQKNLSADHIVPESKGGPTTFENLQTLCRPCNIRKGAR
jgi:hypothetical protein